MPARKTVEGTSSADRRSSGRIITAASAALGGYLREARQAANWSQAELAQKVDCSQSKIAKLEEGSSGMKLADLETLIKIFPIFAERSGEMRLLRDRDHEGRSRPEQRALLNVARYGQAVPDHFRRFFQLEARADSERSWHAESLPGILQSDQYMIAQFKTAGVPDEVLQDLMLIRRDRQKILKSPNSPLFHFMLGEGVFYRMPGRHKQNVLLDQLEHLVRVMDDPKSRVMLNIVPFSAELAYVPADFTMMHFTDGTPEFIYLEHPGGSVELDNITRAVLDLYLQAWDELRGVAFQPVRTRDFMNDMITKLRDSRFSPGADVGTALP